MGTYRKEWDCCGSVTETQAWEPDECPFCATPPSPSTAPTTCCACEGAPSGNNNPCAVCRRSSTAPTVEVDERASFEEWAELTDHQKRGAQHEVVGWYYFDEVTQDRWDAWQARAALASKPPAREAAERQSIDTRDAERFRYIEEHATTHGGGNGFTITCFVPVDEEDMGIGIDKAIDAAPSAGNTDKPKEDP